MLPPTELDSYYDDLEKKSVAQILKEINSEDNKVALAVERCIPQIAPFIDLLVQKMQKGGRLFYIGAGTSGRLGILDASEIPPTFGYEKNNIIGIIAGGKDAVFSAIENAEDIETNGWKDLQAYGVNSSDSVLGITSSGTTPYVLGAMKACKKNNILCSILTCNPSSPIIKVANYHFVTDVGPEYVTGSTRMKGGTAHKMVLNLISTTTMIKLGRVKGNKMSHVALTNKKLIDRGTRIVMEKLNLSYDEAKTIIMNEKNIGGIIK